MDVALLPKAELHGHLDGVPDPAMLRALPCGVALAGPEQGFPAARLAHVLDRYHEAGVPIEIHAGE
jgi:hypothetical protein